MRVYVVLRNYAYEGGQFKGVRLSREEAKALSEQDSDKTLTWGVPDDDGEQCGDEPAGKHGVTAWYTIHEAVLEEASDEEWNGD